MIKTVDGRTMLKVVNDMEAMEPFMLNEDQNHMTFELDGSTSNYIDHDGENIWVNVNDIWIHLSGGGHEIKIPNYNHDTLPAMIENAAELLWFKWGMK